MFGNPNFGFDFPVQEFRDNSVGNFLNPFMDMLKQNAPATSSYMDWSGSMPQRDDFQPSIGRKIGAALTGIASGIGGGDPFGTTFQALNSPYMRAVQQHMERGRGLKETSGAEQGLLGLAGKFSTDAFARKQFHDELAFKNQQLAQQGDIAGKEIGLKLKQLERQEEKDRLDRLLAKDRINIDQYQAGIQAMNAQTHRGQLDLEKSMQPFKILQMMQSGMGGFRGSQPNAAMTNTRLRTALTSDPLIAKHMDEYGRVNPDSLSSDPMAMQRYNEIAGGLGLPSSGFKAPVESPSIWDRLFGNE